MLKNLLSLLFGPLGIDEIERFVRAEYPRDYAAMKREGVRDFEPFVRNVLQDYR